MFSIIKVTSFVFSIFWNFSKRFTLIRFIAYTFTALEPLINAYIIGEIINAIIESAQTKSTEGVTSLLLILTVILLTSRLFSSIDKIASKALEQALRYQPNLVLMDKLNKLDVSKLETPDLNNKVQRYKELSGSFLRYLESYILIVSSTITVLIAGIALALILPASVIAIILVNIPLLITIEHFLKKNFNLKRNYTEEARKVNLLLGSINNSSKFKEVRLTNSYAFILSKYKTYFSSFYNEFVKIRVEWNLSTYIFYASEIFIRILSIWAIVNLAVNEEISIGEIAFYFGIINTFSSTFRFLVNKFINLRDSSINIAEALELFEEPEILNNEEPSQNLENIAIDINELSFKYENSSKQVLKNINLSIKAGEKVAIVGQNGAGKSTLIKILAKMYEPTTGEIIINNTNLNNISHEDWYKTISFLFQDFNTYESLTVRENIAMNQQVDIEKVELSANLATADDFINTYPRKYDQTLSEKFHSGIRPSGGQWQKIAMARFFYRDSSLIVLDEPTSAIDAIAESKIFDNIYNKTKNKTLIIISHRFSTVKKADKIFVLDNGEIVQSGTHSELMSQPGKYKEMYSIQAKEYQEAS